MLSIEAAIPERIAERIAVSMDSGKLVLPEFIEAVYRYGDNVAIVTPDAIVTLPIQAFHNYITDWLEALIEI